MCAGGGKRISEFSLWGRLLPALTLHLPLPPERVGQGDLPGNLSCHSSQLLVSPVPGPPLMKICFTTETYLCSDNPVSRERAFRSPLHPSSFSLVSFLSHCFIPRILPSFCTACVSFFSSNERQGSAKQTPGV